MDDVIDAIRVSFPKTPLFAMGVSAGANCLSLYAGVRGLLKTRVFLGSLSLPSRPCVQISCSGVDFESVSDFCNTGKEA